MTAEKTLRRLPVFTVIVFTITMAVTALQFVFPVVLAQLRRSPEMYSSGEWWRFLTPLFVHSEGWPQIIFNGLCLAILGPMVERRYGPYRCLALYFVSGFVGELAGLAWKPTGAGASVACCGLLGGLAIWRWLRDRTPRGRIVCGAILTFAVTLTAIHDLHGPPILAGMFLAVLMLRFSSSNVEVL
jgi:membrane associated rhomboid family serine protease